MRELLAFLANNIRRDRSGALILRPVRDGDPWVPLSDYLRDYARTTAPRPAATAPVELPAAALAAPPPRLVSPVVTVAPWHTADGPRRVALFVAAFVAGAGVAGLAMHLARRATTRDEPRSAAPTRKGTSGRT